MITDHLQKARALLSKVSQGDEHAFSELFYLTSPGLLLTIRQLVKEEEVAGDLLQEIFIKAWLHRHALAGMENPIAWLKKTANNSCIDHLRRRQVEAKWLREVSGSADTYDDRSAASHRELFQMLQRAVSSLPPQQKKIYELSREQGLSRREIATQLNLSENTVRNHLALALEHIKAFLAKAGLLTAILAEWL